MNLRARVARGAVALCVAVLPLLVAAQASYPTHPVRLVVPFAVGGSTGALAQLLAVRLSAAWGQQVFVDAKGGGNTVIGTEYVAKAPPDGYTLLLTSNSHVVIPQLMTTPFEPIKDFVPVATISRTELILVVNPTVPAQTLAEFLALAKARPGQINYASAGNASATHLAGEAFGTVAGVKLQHVPYKGSGPAMTDLLGGQVQASFQTPIVAIPMVKSGQLRALAVTGEKRLAALPQVPTFAESGIAKIGVTTWFGIVAPAGTPGAITDRVAHEIDVILRTPEFVQKLGELGMDPFISTSAQFADLIKATQVDAAQVIKASNIKLE